VKFIWEIWYKKAAADGHAEAQWFIGKCYRYGYWIGSTYIVQKNLVEAYKWLLLASQNGCSKADADLAKVRKYLSNSEISEAENRAKLETTNENIQSVQ
jgi:TPR repeat protein